MALTTAQENAALRQIVGIVFDHTDEALLPFLRACVAYGRQGGAGSPQEEAARTFARLAWQQVIGHAPSAGELHTLINHRVIDADPTAAGVIV